MALTKCYLGDHIELRQETNTARSFGAADVRGVNSQKKLITTKANINERDLTKFRIVYPGDFVFNRRTSLNGGRFSIAYNDGSQPVICTEDYVVFHIRESSRQHLLSEWLYMYVNRAEFDRYVITNSWGSSTEFFHWEDLCAVELKLPSLAVQEKYVAVYKAMVADRQSFERGLEDLKLVCDGYIEELRRNTPGEKIGPYIEKKEERNYDLTIKLAQGITVDKQFAPPKQVAEEGKYAKIVRKGQFAYNRTTTRNQEKISIAYREGEDCVVSSAYQVFEIKDKNKLLPEYLMMWFKRSEFDRYARYMSHGSTHEYFEFEDMCNVQIPIPDVAVQKAIAEVYSVYTMRKRIIERLNSQINSICPVLIKGSVSEFTESNRVF